MKTKNPVMLVILDGFGEGKPRDPGNAPARADMKFYKSLCKKYPKTLLKTDSQAVGLPKKSQGGSEVGHFTMGSGRITRQSLEEINRSIKKSDFYKLKPLKQACKRDVLHLVGMISDQARHANIQHLFALLETAKRQKTKKIYIHAILDGRDVPEKSASKYLKMIDRRIKKLKLQGVAEVATMIGRYYAMDRDQNWKRTEKAYNLLVLGKGEKAKTPLQGIKNAYATDVQSDYYVEPIILNSKATIKSKDAVVFFNYRTDRARQLTWALTGEKPPKDSGVKKLGFKPKKRVRPYFVAMGPYSEKAPVLFPTPLIKKNLAEILSTKGYRELRIAETEKYAHVTFFFNSQIEKPFPGEDHILVPSPKCPSYAEKPEMSARKITKHLVSALKKEDHDVIIVNYANGDLVGHSGDLKAAIECCQVLDECLEKVIPTALKHGYTTILTSDHGNCDEMLYKNGEPKPSHTLNPVPCLLISDQKYRLKKKRGLQDIAPTILELLKIKKP
ncbi:2,3-bisphosphoglycerate-independent phosphoglycerate mutase, partial [Candidatus Peregrinibacteria bacterium]|nr:2,3-bisphosphoglycerate-independent phosphoglycerate mutase [Candidatus Peregrinibacteria bacterium]